MSSIIKSSFAGHVQSVGMPFASAGVQGIGSAPIIKRDAVNTFLQEYPEHDELTELERLREEKKSCTEDLEQLRQEIEQAQQELAKLSLNVEETKFNIEEMEAQRRELENLIKPEPDAQAAQIISQAEQEAAQLMADKMAQGASEADKLRAQGYLDGLEQGAAEAREQVRAENQPGIEKLSLMIRELAAMKNSLLAEYEDEIINLSIEIAEKIVCRQIEENPELIVSMLRETIEQNRREEYIKVILGKDLIPVEGRVTQDIKEAIRNMAEQIDLVVDPEGVEGKLIVETAQGFCDLSVTTQLDNISEILRER